MANHEQRSYVDYRNLGDTGQDVLDSIQAIQQGEPARYLTVRRPDENLRSRTEIARSALEDSLYYRDRSHYTLELAPGGTLTWSGLPVGLVDNTTELRIRPLLAPRTNTLGSLDVGTAGVNRVTYSVVAGNYTTDGMDRITVEHLDGGVATVLAVTITPGPVKRIKVLFDSTAPTHDAPSVAAAVNIAIAGDADLAGRFTATNNGVALQAIAATAETHVDGSADNELHTVSANALSVLTTATPLQEGDCIAVWYRYLIEPVGGDPGDPKGGIAGGRAESIAGRGNTDVTNNLFITTSEPSKIPGAIPLCRVVGGQLVWLDGTRLPANGSGVPGTALTAYIDASVFSGLPTNANNGGIDTAATSVQDAFVSVDQRLAQRRVVTWTCTDNLSSQGGDFSGATALTTAIAALPAQGGRIVLRPGTYTVTMPYSVPADVHIEAESEGSVTLQLAGGAATFFQLGARSSLKGVAITTAGAGRGLYLSGARSRAERVQAPYIAMSGKNARLASSSATQLEIYSGCVGATVASVDTISALLSGTGLELSGFVVGDGVTSGQLVLGQATLSNSVITGLTVLGQVLVGDCQYVTVNGGTVQALAATANAAVYAPGALLTPIGALTLNDVAITTAGTQRLIDISKLTLHLNRCTVTGQTGLVTPYTVSAGTDTDLRITDSVLTFAEEAIPAMQTTRLTATRTAVSVAWGAGNLSGLYLGQAAFRACDFVNITPVSGGYIPLHVHTGTGTREVLPMIAGPVVAGLSDAWLNVFEDCSFDMASAEVPNTAGNPDCNSGTTDTGIVFHGASARFSRCSWLNAPIHVRAISAKVGLVCQRGAGGRLTIEDTASISYGTATQAGTRAITALAVVAASGTPRAAFRNFRANTQGTPYYHCMYLQDDVDTLDVVDCVWQSDLASIAHNDTAVVSATRVRGSMFQATTSSGGAEFPSDCGYHAAIESSSFHNAGTGVACWFRHTAPTQTQQQLSITGCVFRSTGAAFPTPPLYFSGTSYFSYNISNSAFVATYNVATVYAVDIAAALPANTATIGNGNTLRNTAGGFAMIENPAFPLSPAGGGNYVAASTYYTV